MNRPHFSPWLCRDLHVVLSSWYTGTPLLQHAQHPNFDIYSNCLCWEYSLPSQSKERKTLLDGDTKHVKQKPVSSVNNIKSLKLDAVMV